MHTSAADAPQPIPQPTCATTTHAGTSFLHSAAGATLMAHLTCAAKHRPASWSGWRQAILPPRDAEAKASKSARGPRTGGQGPPGRREEIACPKISGRGSPARNVELFKPPPTVPSRDYTLHKYECGPPPTLSARRVPLRSLRSHDRASSNKCAVQPIRPSPSLRQAGRLSLAAVSYTHLTLPTICSV